MALPSGPRPFDVAEARPALRVGDLLQSAPHVDALHVGDRRGVKVRREIPVRRQSST
jgi:hypothetical protein